MDALTPVLYVMFAQGILGASDTIYFHEWRHRLTANVGETRVELLLHAFRDFIYAGLFSTLPWFAWGGSLVIGLWLLLAIEVVITLLDFAVEVKTRASLGGLPGTERTMHAVMAIVYGAFLALLLPVTATWRNFETGWIAHEGSPRWLAYAMTLMGLGVFLSGLRDLAAALGFKAMAWPWAGGEVRHG